MQLWHVKQGTETLVYTFVIFYIIEAHGIWITFIELSYIHEKIYLFLFDEFWSNLCLMIRELSTSNIYIELIIPLRLL